MRVAVAFDHRGVRLRDALLAGGERYAQRLQKIERLERAVSNA